MLAAPATFGSIPVSSGQDSATATWHVNVRRICSSLNRSLQSSQMGQHNTVQVLPLHSSPVFETQCSTSSTTLQWQLAIGLSESKCVGLLLKHVQAQAGSGVAVKATFDLTFTILGKQRLPLTVTNKELSHAFTPSNQLYGMDLGLTPCQLQTLLGSDHAVIELNLTHSCIHTTQPELLPGLLMCSQPMISLISLEPRILLIDNLLSAADCQLIMDLARPDLHRSRVAKGDMTPSRTSCSTFLTGQKAFHPNIQSFEDRVSELIALPAVMTGQHPLYKTEAVQVVRYQSGEFYAEHFDNKADDCSKRACTIMTYLSDVDVGGETYFRRSTGCSPNMLGPCAAESSLHPSGPTASGHSADPSAPAGLRIRPKQGRAIMFWSRLPNGQEDRASLHSGEAVESGEKWIASRWLKEDYTDQQTFAEE